MESVLGRYKNLIVLTAVIFVQVLGLAVQVKRTTDNESSRLIRVWAVGAVTPFEKVLVGIQTSTRSVWHNYFYLRGVRAENRELRQKIEQMQIEQVRLSQDADQARRLQALLGFKEQFISQTMAAQVIGSSGSELSRSIYIDKGEKDGIKPDMAVITTGAVVGKVLRVYRSTSLVLLINDQTSGVGAILEKSRLQGILRGTPAGEVVLEKVMSDESVPVGESVLTSGGDRIFPKGLPIGTVTRVSPGNDLFLNIRVKPVTDLSKLEEVLVVTKIDEKQAAPDATGPVRAADILAERLPTVPPKPQSTDPAKSAAKQPGDAANEDAEHDDSADAPTKPAVASHSVKTGQNGANTVKAPGSVNNAGSKPVPAVSNDGAKKPTSVDVSQKANKPAETPKPQPPTENTPQ
jgi:rod shape-determining protein MreC